MLALQTYLWSLSPWIFKNGINLLVDFHLSLSINSPTLVVFFFFLINSTTATLTNLGLVMGRVPMWKGPWGSEPIITLGKKRALYEKNTLPIPSCLRGDAVVPLPSHSWIRV